ncbi:malate dehydrogenase (quinone) [Pedobacter sp. SG918]|uniref:malate dehydrogenase (quinone) n=1 Tax=Pedobacter sp. SG918 TaxID=2587136 RepID=UPI00146B76E8|nr:malate dehydrogenase (quinone) [Pedobacter sp. SG918]NMN35049.1 malate dehydrogenase (quinone) [Pedobacter sp. SG918]
MKNILLILLISVAIVGCRNKEAQEQTDVVLVGAGIMSATLGSMIKTLDPKLKINIYERLDLVAAESSDAWNNAGTGHSAFCELNYTPELPNGQIEFKKAISINEHFEVSKQFWAYMVSAGKLPSPTSFINNVPHISFVWGDKNVLYLKKRYDVLSKQLLFKGMKYSENYDTLAKWMPLVMKGRSRKQKVAATYMSIGTDVNFGSLTRGLISSLRKEKGVKVELNHEVKNLKRNPDGTWLVTVTDLKTEKDKYISAKFVFIGAGGGALRLLQKSKIPEGKGFGGFPVSGEWLVCNNQKIVEKHISKVYGKAGVGAPPMSVPHLDTRIINGKKALLFGPYAGFSSKFLKQGSYLDLTRSITLKNMWPMLSTGMDNIPLTKYLIRQVTQSDEDRLKALKEYFPEAEAKDWKLETAGQRVQIIKKDKTHGGVLQFGTEVVSAQDGSLAALLGASPGASTSVDIMLTLLKQCFPKEVASNAWQQGLRKMIPSYGKMLSQDVALANQVRSSNSKTLGLNFFVLDHTWETGK